MADTRSQPIPHICPPESARHSVACDGDSGIYVFGRGLPGERNYAHIGVGVDSSGDEERDAVAFIWPNGRVTEAETVADVAAWLRAVEKWRRG